MKHIHELLGYENIKIIQDDDMFSFSIDALLLASFIEVTSKVKNIMDLCTGNGPIPLYLSLKTNAKIVGVEIQKDIAEMAISSVKLNGLEDRIEIVNDDLKDIYKKGYANMFDIVSVNPPYFKYLDNSHTNKNDYLTIARHEVKATFMDIVNAANKLLFDGGRLYFIQRVSRMQEILATLDEYNFSCNKMLFVYPKISDKEALLVLVEAKKNRKSECKVLKPLYIYNKDNSYTKEVLDIFNYKKA